MSEDQPHLTSISSNLLLLLPLLLSLIRATSQELTDSSLQTDKQVLLQLKQSLQNSNPLTHGAYSSWDNSDPSPCTWPGITCSGVTDPRVTGISLSASTISGSVFHNFSGLPELTHLDLSRNTISGQLPPDINRCTNLHHLNLSHNLIDGELNLTGLTQLVSLDVTLNRFNGTIHPYFPAACPNLITLNLSSNSFSGDITGCFDACPALNSLDLSSNCFTGEAWMGFSSLSYYSISANNFTGAVPPETFPEDCSLRELDLSSNSLHGVFPDSISNCSGLNTLSLWGNRFAGGIPAGIGSLSELTELYLGNNSFSRDVPERLTNCSNLSFLDLSRSGFGGDVQQVFGQFKNLKFLVLHSNSYTGGIRSSGVLKLRSLRRLDLSFNNFSGELPVEIAEMPSLKFLILAHNNFSGDIPLAYGNITGIQAMDLSFNNLTGGIPSSIGRLRSLLWLMLADNQLTGTIPPEIGDCNSLLWLNLARNRLNGTIPQSLMRIGSDPDATFLANRRAGGVPAGSGECLTMKRWLPANYPPFSFAYTLMTRKSCRDTWDKLLKGVGILPVCKNSYSPVRTMETSGYVQLSGNRLSGELPPGIGGMKNLSLLHVDANLLSGRLPPEIGGLTRLVVFNASYNHLSGGIPAELGDIKCMNNLDLSRNNFSGEFPASLNQLTDLEKFNVSYNPLLSGAVPATGQLATFESDSFLGDPLITFQWSAGRMPGGIHGRKESARVAKIWVFLLLTVVFFVCGVASLVKCIAGTAPVDQEPADIESVKQNVKNASSSSSSSVKVFRLDKTAFTYGDIVTATGGFGEGMVVGSGGYGIVYKGVLPDGRRVAVKKLQREGPEGEREFRAEMEVLAGGGPHPNLVPLYGWCLSGAEKLLVYEYMEGGSLEEAVGDWRRMGWRGRVAAAEGVAAALAFLHHECRPAVVHRDVKASNVMMDGEGRARVTDFGLARVVGAGESHVSTVVAGTVGYVAPEYGQTWRATTRGDVYSFGVLAMELATGRRALGGGDQGECLVDWVRREGWRAVAPPPEEMEGMAAMSALLRVGMRCTAEVPQERPDMREVLVMLSKIHDSGKTF